jgi:hypothetical protein
MDMSQPTIEEVKALDGKVFAMLTEQENDVLSFYRARGRKFGVSISFSNDADLKDLARAGSNEQEDQIRKKSNSRVSVTVTT